MKKVFNVLSGLLLAVLIGSVVLVLLMRLSGKNTGLFGYRLYYVVSGSMEPTLHVGDVVLCRERGPEQLHNGDILVYDGKDGELAGKTITHRIIEEPSEVNGSWQIKTQGDAEGTIPDPLVGGDQVIGVVLTRLQLITRLYSFFITPWGLLAVCAPVAWALVSEVRNLILMVKEEKSDGKTA